MHFFLVLRRDGKFHLFHVSCSPDDFKNGNCIALLERSAIFPEIVNAFLNMKLSSLIFAFKRKLILQ